MIKEIQNITQKHGSAVFINTDNIQHNYKFLQQTAPRSTVAAVLKSNAYGLGATVVAKTLHEAGCTDYFVATVLEAINIRSSVGEHSNIYVLHPVFKDSIEQVLKHNLIPVISSLSQLTQWVGLAKHKNQRIPCVIHLDTGMSRLGLAPSEAATAAELYPNLQQILELRYIISHLACSGHPTSPVNHQQLLLFQELCTLAPFAGIKQSIAASAAIFLGSEYALDMIRPGFALYGSNPTLGQENPLNPVISYYTTVLKLNLLAQGQAIGYDHLWRAPGTCKIATVAVGYSDGISIAHAKGASLYIKGQKVPIVGRVSMDSLMLDITHVLSPVKENDVVEIIGPHQNIDDFANLNNTINCVALNMLPTRYPKFYYKK